MITPHILHGCHLVYNPWKWCFCFCSSLRCCWTGILRSNVADLHHRIWGVCVYVCLCVGGSVIIQLITALTSQHLHTSFISLSSVWMSQRCDSRHGFFFKLFPQLLPVNNLSTKKCSSCSSVAHLQPSRSMWLSLTTSLSMHSNSCDISHDGDGKNLFYSFSGTTCSLGDLVQN